MTKKSAHISAKKLVFANEYLKDRNAKQAAIRAGYSKKTAGVIGPKIRNESAVKAYIDKKTKEMTEAALEKSQVTLDDVVASFKKIRDSCMSTTTMQKQVKRIDADGKKAIDLVEVEVMLDPANASRANENLGKMLGGYREDNEQNKDILTLNLKDATDEELAAALAKKSKK